jgi:cytochrome b6-f complex iron-sulfur subunit
MTSRCGGQYCFSVLLASIFLFFSACPSFADPDLSETASLSTNIITAGIVGACLLALYVAFLSATFLMKALKESAAAKKEAAAHRSHDDHKTGGLALSLVTWIGVAFAAIAFGSLFIVGFMVLIETDLSSTSSIGSFIISTGCLGFAVLALYVLYLTLSFLWKALRGVSEVDTHGRAHAPLQADLASAIPLNAQVTRRSFLSLLGWAWVAFTAATMGAVSTMLRFAFPNVTFEPPLKFTAGFPNTYSIGVDERFKDGHRVWIVRDQKGFYALSTICTHLGCTPNWLLAEQKFKCPCHGSGFYITGVNFEGPAPRPLERFQITLADDGQIVVDENVKFQQELGQWGLPGSFLEYKA